MSTSALRSARLRASERPIIGAEAGAGWINLAEWHRDGWRTTHVAWDPAIGTDARELARALKAAGFSGRTVACALTDPDIDIFPVVVSGDGARDAERVVVQEAKNRLHYPLDHATIDFSLLPTAVRRQEEEGHALVYACERERVLTLVRLLEDAGLSVACVDTPGNVWAQAVGRRSGDRHVVLATSETATSLSVVEAGCPLIERILPWGRRPLVDRIGRALGLSAERAARVLHAKSGIGGADAAVHDILMPAFQELAREVATSVGYSTSFLTSRPAASILVGGSVAPLEALADAFAPVLPLPVRDLRPFLDAEEHDQQWLTARAAAVGGVS